MDSTTDVGASVVLLRERADGDLAIFFEQQLDPEANRMAAFAAKDPSDREKFMGHWEKLLSDPVVVVRTIIAGGKAAGYVASFLRDKEREVCYWLGREFWGRGITTEALRAFLNELTERPLHARAAADNIASNRVLEKCGFVQCGKSRGFSHVRGVEVEEIILVLR